MTLTAHQYNTVSGVIRLLKPFDELTVMCSSDTEIASCIIPNVKTTQKYLTHLTESDKDAGVRTMKNALLDSVKRDFQIQKIHQEILTWLTRIWFLQHS